MSFRQHFDVSDYLPVWTVNNYYTAANHAANTATFTIGQFTAHEIIIPRATTIDRLGVQCTTLGDTTAKARIGIYQDNGNNLPGTLVIDGGLTVAISTTGYKEITIGSPPSVGPGIYWLACAMQSTAQTSTAYSSAPTMRIRQGMSPYIGASQMNSPQQAFAGYLGAATYTGLPNPFGAIDGTTNIYPVRVWARCAS